MEHYIKGTKLPRRVKKAIMKDDYYLDTVRLLCWSAIPPASIIPRQRLRFVAMEALFTNIFFSAVEYKVDHLWLDQVPWDRDMVEWLPGNSHSPLNEQPQGDLSLSPEQLAKLHATRKANQDAYNKVYSTLRYGKEIAKNKDVFLGKRRKLQSAWAKKNPERQKEIAAQSKARILAEKRHYCADCDKAFEKPYLLKKHLNHPDCLAN
jgi:hypothetical protein